MLPLTPVPDDPWDGDFAAIGEIRTALGSAAFDDWRVVGPQVNLTRLENGLWSGTLLGVDVRARPSPGKLVGTGVNLSFVRWQGEVIVRGNVGGMPVRVRVAPGAGVPTGDGIYCRWNVNLVDCRTGHQAHSAGIRLHGVAALTDQPLMPQFGLALIAATYYR